MSGEMSEWNHLFGIALFNQAWELIDKPDRSADDDIEMLLRAMTSRWHWQQVGGPEQIATGDWQVAHVASLLGFGEVAKAFAERNLAATIELGADGWRLASAHEGMARACAAIGDRDGRDRHLAVAREALERETDADERKVIEDQIASIPELV
jgi:hypothetical protein